jgi:hypothetical protein
VSYILDQYWTDEERVWVRTEAIAAFNSGLSKSAAREQIKRTFDKRFPEHNIRVADAYARETAKLISAYHAAHE